MDLNSKLFPIDYSSNEIRNHIKESVDKLEHSFLTEGEKHKLERDIVLCQNHLVMLSMIESNEKLSSQQKILVKTERRATLLTIVVIMLTLLTLIYTIYLEHGHAVEADQNQKQLIKVLNENSKAEIREYDLMKNKKDSIIILKK